MSLRDMIPWRSHGAELERARDPFVALQSEMNDLLEHFFDRPTTAWSSHGIFPHVDVKETKKEVRVVADLPGMEEKDIEAFVSDDVLTIRGERKTEKEESEDGRSHLERTYGAFERTIPLPCAVQADDVQADYKKGVLTIRLPKAPEAQQSKRIQIG